MKYSAFVFSADTRNRSASLLNAYLACAAVLRGVISTGNKALVQFRYQRMIEAAYGRAPIKGQAFRCKFPYGVVFCQRDIEHVHSDATS